MKKVKKRKEKKKKKKKRVGNERKGMIMQGTY